MSFYDQLLSSYTQLAVLIDPEKAFAKPQHKLYEYLAQGLADLVLVGGSTLEEDVIDEVILDIRNYCALPVGLFPGNLLQLSPLADGLLLPSLISGNNPEYLIGHHISSAIRIKELDIEVTPVGYILISGGINSATSYITHTAPIDSQDIELIVRTALAGELLGMKAIYLEAGSGASEVVPLDAIQAVKDVVKVPVIVGGGIDNITKFETILKANPEMIVIGNALEHNPDLLLSLREAHLYHKSIHEARSYHKIYR